MDYNNAFLMELIDKKIVSRNIEFESTEKNNAVNPNLQGVPVNKNKEHHLQSAYFVEISDIISNYNKVVLFGPAESKNELFNLLKFDHDFDHIKIQSVNTDKMTELQLHDFVREYYQ